MSTPELLRLLLLFRMIAFLAFMYLVFGWIVERTARDPESKVRGFARLVCSPLTKPVETLMAAESPYPLVLRNTLYVFAGIWFTIFALSEYALAP